MGIVNRILKTLRQLVLFSMGSAFLPAGNVYAADNWAYQPSFEQDFSSQTNPLLLSGSQKTLFGSVTTPQLLVTDTTPTTTVAAKAALSENVYNQSSFNSTDMHGHLDLDQKLERWEAGITSQLDYDTTRTSEISTLNINTIGFSRHYGESATPTIAYNLSPIDKISLNGSALESRYDSDLFTDYHIVSAGTSYQHSFTPLNIGTLSLTAQRYQSEGDVPVRVDNLGPNLGWTSTLTPNLTAKLSIGLQDYQQTGAGIPDQQWQWQTIYDASLSYKDTNDNVALDASRSLQPYANGTEFYLNTIVLSEKHDLNSLFSANANASYQFAGNSEQTSTNLKSLVGAGAGLTYHATEKVDVAASYQYREQTLTNVAGDQNDNLFLVNLVYRPKLDGIHTK